MVSNIISGSARPKTHTDMVLHNLNLEVPNWTVKDVAVWIKKIGFEKYVDDIIDLELDGDLLLKLDESNLQSDLNITNGILRKRFMRELNSLKRNADYSAKDRHGLARMIKNYKPDLMIYANDLIEAIDEPGYLHNMTLNDLDDHLRNVANIKSVIHRQEIIKVLDDFCQTDSVQGSEQSSDSFSRSVSLNSADSCPVYMSHAGPHETEQLASLIALQLQLRGFSLFESKLDKNINISVMASEDEDCLYDSSKVLERSYSESMEKCSHLVLVLGQGSLDQLMKKTSGNANSDQQVQVPLYYEIVAALKSKKTTIIPVLAPGFQFPDPDDLLPEVRALLWMNAVNFIHEYREASMDKIEKFIRGEVFCKSVLDLTTLTINDGAGNLQKVKTLNRSGWSTPGSSVHLAIPSFNNGCRSRYASSTDIAMN